MQVVTKTHIPDYPLVSRGKVRDMYAVEDDILLIVTTDRMSAFDVIMAEPVPYKGVILNQITLFWMRRFEHLCRNHILEEHVERFPEPLQAYRSMLEGRSVLARRATPLPVECIVRGNISGSGWKDYLASGTVSGHCLPPGLRKSERLPEPLFSPSTKAELGEHDENITRDRAMHMLGQPLFHKVEDLSLAMFTTGRDYAESRGLILADTKFEFGLVEGDLYLIDEVLTPDSSRIWPSRGFAPGKEQPSFDKQYLRDWLEAQPWDKKPPPPSLPRDVIEETGRKYREAYALLTGKELALPD